MRKFDKNIVKRNYCCIVFFKKYVNVGAFDNMKKTRKNKKANREKNCEILCHSHHQLNSQIQEKPVFDFLV